MRRLEKIQEEVGVLKTIIVHDIAQIFNNLYPNELQTNSPIKFDPPGTADTPHKHSPISADPHLGQASGEARGGIEGEKKKYPEEGHNLRGGRLERGQEPGVTPFSLGSHNDSMRIEDDDEDELDLICYEDDIPVEGQVQKKTASFSPIAERPMEEEYSVEKAVREATLKGVRQAQRLFGRAEPLRMKVKGRRFNYLRFID